MKPSSILCAVDFSEPSRAALDEACDLARDWGSRLILAHAFQSPLPPVAEIPVGLPDLVQRAAAPLEKLLVSWRDEVAARGVAVEAHLVEGPAWDRVVHLAREKGCGLIVVGTQGRTGLKHALVGSVAEKIVRHAPCSVLVVRPVQP